MVSLGFLGMLNWILGQAGFWLSWDFLGWIGRLDLGLLVPVRAGLQPPGPAGLDSGILRYAGLVSDFLTWSAHPPSWVGFSLPGLDSRLSGPFGLDSNFGRILARWGLLGRTMAFCPLGFGFWPPGGSWAGFCGVLVFAGNSYRLDLSAFRG